MSNVFVVVVVDVVDVVVVVVVDVVVVIILNYQVSLKEQTVDNFELLQSTAGSVQYNLYKDQSFTTNVERLYEIYRILLFIANSTSNIKETKIDNRDARSYNGSRTS